MKITTPAEALEYFGKQARIVDAINAHVTQHPDTPARPIKKGAVSAWFKNGRIPVDRIYQLNEIINGEKWHGETSEN